MFHLKIFHEHEQNFTITCHHPDCKKTFKKVSSLRRHDVRNHASKIFVNSQNDETSLPETKSDLILSDVPSYNEELGLLGATGSDSQTEEWMLEEFKKHLASHLLSVKEKHLLPDTVQENITSELFFFIKYTSDCYKTLVKKGLSEINVLTTDSQILSRILSEDNVLFDRAAEELNSKFKLKNYVSSNFPYIAACPYLLNDEDESSQYHYIPLTDLLKKVISRPDVYKQLSKDQHRVHDTDVLYDTCDGQCHKQSDALSQLCLHLQFYVDEFETCNPIGSKRGKFKLTAVYFTIGDLPKRYRYTDDTLFLSLLVRHPLLKQFDPTYQKVFSPLIQDLKILNRGLEFEVNGEKKLLTAVVNFIIGDNLSSHAVGGFQTHFTSGHMCRHCSVDYSQFREILSVSALSVRDNAVYADQMNLLEQDSEVAMMCGIKYKCAFSDLSYFTVPDSFPPDLMHDCLEGIIPVTLQLVLRDLKKDNVISVEEINLALSQVRLPTCDKPNFFPENFFSAGCKIVGSAAQKLELFYILPQILDVSKVSNFAAWDVYLILRECMDILLSPVIERDMLPYLSDVIESYLLKFKDTFGAEKLIPKHHFLMHTPSMIRKFGPLRNFWCMPFETKHQYFKKLIKNTKNFINITHTLSQRHQMKLAHALGSHKFLHDGTEPVSAVKSIDTKNLPATLIEAIQEKVGKTFTTKRVSSVKKLRRCGLVYEVNPNLCYVMDCVEVEHVPCFGQVKHIVCVEGQWYLCLKMYLPKSYVEEAHAYEVECQLPWYIACPEELTDCHKHRLYRKGIKIFAFTVFNVTPYNKDL